MNKTILIRLSVASFLVLVVATLYGRFLHNPIVFDDIYFFLLDAAGEQPVSGYQFDWFQLRSLPYATLAWTKAWFGLDLIYFRIGNLLLHASVCMALYLFLRALLEVVGPELKIFPGEEERVSTHSIALVTAVLFAVHPVATFAAGYLVQRTILFATLFSLLAMWAWVLGSVRNQSSFHWLAAVFYFFAVFSKEHAVMLVAVMPVLTVLLQANWKQRMLQRVGVHAAMVATAIFVVLAQKNILGSIYEVRASEMLLQSRVEYHYLSSVVTQMALFFKYAFLWLVPNPNWMSIDMREAFAVGPSFTYVCAVIAFLTWGAVGSVLLFKRGSRALLGFSMLFPWLMFMTELSTVRIQEVFVLYRSYLWASGALCAVPLVLYRLTTRKLVAIVLPGVLVLYVLSMQSLVTMSHPILLWEQAKQLLDGRDELPGTSRIYYNLGIQYFKADRYDRAVLEFRRTVDLSPAFAEAYGYLGVSNLRQGAWQDSVAALSKGMEIEAKKGPLQVAKYLVNRAQAYELGGNLQQAQADYRESCRLLKTGCEKIR